MTKFFTSPLLFNIVSFTLTILSIVLAVIFYYRSLNTKIPCYSVNGRKLLDEALIKNHSLIVLFRDQPVEALSVSYIAFWNNGRGTITKEDIATNDPIQITLSDNNKVLAVDIITTNRRANNFTVNLQEDKTAVRIEMDFADYKNGALIRMYHSGNSGNIEITGTIKGASNIINANRVTENAFLSMERVNKWFQKNLFRFVPWRIFSAFFLSNQPSCIFSLLLVLPVMIIFSPIIILYMIVMMIMFVVTLITVPISMFQYSVPKEIYLKIQNETGGAG